MKGKKLIELFDTLSKSNKHVILNKCKASNDKRQKKLYSLLIDYQGGKKKFQEALNSIGSNLTENNDVKKDKAIRRFIDFAVNLTEDVIIQEHINRDKSLRNNMLSTIFKNQNHLNLQESYLRKLHNKKIDSMDRFIQEQYYDDSIVLLSRSQKKKDFKKWWDLIDKKYELSNDVYTNAVTETYELASTLYLVDNEFGKEIIDKMMDTKHLELLLDVVQGSKRAIEIKIAEVRFNFGNREKALTLMNEIHKEVKLLQLNEKEFDELLRKVNYVAFMLAFKYNTSMAETKSFNQKLLDLSLKYSRTDSVNKFYRVFLLMVEDNTIDINYEIEKIKPDMVIHNDEFLLDFLRSLHGFFNEDYKTALLYINDLSYAPNESIRLWSKQIELLVHYKKENFDLCEILAERIHRQIQKSNAMTQTLVSSAQFQQQMFKLLNLKPSSLYNDLSSGFSTYSIFHNALLKYI
jgi:hypothetical protein